jgi:hypothetical protein
MGIPVALRTAPTSQLLRAMTPPHKQDSRNPGPNRSPTALASFHALSKILQRSSSEGPPRGYRVHLLQRHLGSRVSGFLEKLFLERTSPKQAARITAKSDGDGLEVCSPDLRGHFDGAIDNLPACEFIPGASEPSLAKIGVAAGSPPSGKILEQRSKDPRKADPCRKTGSRLAFS